MARRTSIVAVLLAGALAAAAPALAQCPDPVSMTVEPASGVGGAIFVTVLFTFASPVTAGCKYHVTSTNGALASPVSPFLGVGTSFGTAVSAALVPGSSPVSIVLTGGRLNQSPTSESGPFSGATFTQSLTLNPITPTSISVSRATIRTGENATLTVRMNSGLVLGRTASVSLSAVPNGVLTMPSSAQAESGVDIPGSGTSARARVTITGGSVSSATEVTITARRSGVEVTRTITVEPPAAAAASALELRQGMRKLWSDHVIWTRGFIVATVAGDPSASTQLNRLMRNQEDIGNAIVPYYGAPAGIQLTALLKDHIRIAGDVLTAAKANDQAGLAAADKRWRANATDIATFLSGANPNWKKTELEAMLNEHLDLTTQEATARLQQRWADDVATFDRIFEQALGMADALTNGIIRQFPART